MPDIRELRRDDPTLTPGELGRLVADQARSDLACDGIDAAGELICEAVERFVDSVTDWRSR
jgi:hypothetical protein